MSRLVKYLLILSLFMLFHACSSLEDNVEKNLTIPDKITILFVTQPSCPSCKKLENTMNLPQPKELLNKYFNVKRLYLGEKLPDGLMEPQGTPAVYFLGSDNEILLETMIGEKDEEILMYYLEDALLEFKNTYKVDLVKKHETNT